eukprot:652601-Amorphochlora_amoeboformis.AAC.1
MLLYPNLISTSLSIFSARPDFMPEAAPSTKLDQTLSRLAEEIEKGEEEGLTRQVGGLEEESAEISEVGVVSEEG